MEDWSLNESECGQGATVSQESTQLMGNHLFPVNEPLLGLLSQPGKQIEGELSVENNFRAFVKGKDVQGLLFQLIYTCVPSLGCRLEDVDDTVSDPVF